MPDTEIKPLKMNKEESSLPEVNTKFAPGELVGTESLRSLYGYNLEQLPKKYQDILRNLCQKIAQTDLYARIEEVVRATEQRFYWRSMFEVYFSSKNMVWEFPGTTDWGEGDGGNVALHYSFNVYQEFGRGFITQVGITPSVRFIPTNLNDPNASRIADSADALRRKIEFQNKVDVLAERVARLFWTDGRVALYSRWVSDGSRFGYEDQDHVEEKEEGLGEGGKPPKKKPRQPKGGAVISGYGVLETKVPINMRDLSDFPFIQLSYEIDLTSAKSLYPNISSSISGGETGPGEYSFDRTSRLAITQGTRLLAQTGDTVAALPTYQRSWIRPSYFANIDNQADREFFEDNFPDGVFVAFIGDTYAESRNESMDDHWRLAYPIDADGQATPSCGYLMLDVQDAINDLTDLQMETFMKAIPAIYGNKDVIDFKALSKEKAGPGAHWPTKRPLAGNEKMTDQFWAEPEVKFPEEAAAFYSALMSSIPQSLTGLLPAALGDADPNNETKGGILALRDAARGQSGVAWKAFRRAYAESMEQLIRIESYFRSAEAEDGIIKVTSPGREEITIDLEDLRDGNYFCVPDSDESYPKTNIDKQINLQNIITAAGAGVKTAINFLDDPENAKWMRQIIGDPDMSIPGADEADQQMEEISQLLQESPIPNQESTMQYTVLATAAKLSGKPVPPQPPTEQLFRPSVPIDAQLDNNAIHLQRGKDWLASPAGRRAKKENPDGFMNVRLHLLAHANQISQDTVSQAKAALAPQLVLEQAKHPPTPTKTPAESINFKDLGPSGQLQVGKQAGLDLTADVAADLAKQHFSPDQAQQ